MRGCNASDHRLDDAKFAGPLKWVGVYVAAASIYCAVMMFLDLLGGVRKRKLWFPCKWFSLNATTLTILGIAIKFPVDINTSMPGRHDQLTKLSGTVLLCTVMGNIMPSLGAMSDSEILPNVVALAILVITVIANICIQMGTGLIYAFWVEHIVVMAFLVFVLFILLATAFPVPLMKLEIEKMFDNKYDIMPQEEEIEEGTEAIITKKVEKFWLMAHTGSPQYVVGRSATCMASGAFCLLAFVVLIEAFLRSLFHGSSFCIGDSDYSWSTKAVFYTQAATIAVGFLAPFWRWVNARSCNGWKYFTVEEYWVKWFKDWNDEDLPFDNGRRWKRKLMHCGKTLISNLLIGLEYLFVFLSKLVAVLPLNGILGLLVRRLFSNRSNLNDNEATSLRRFVLHLEGEDDLVDAVTRSEHRDVERWIEKGKSKKPTKLIRLINMTNADPQRGFPGVMALDRDRVEALVCRDLEPQNCWAMPIVALAGIAVALPGVSKNDKKSLLEEVYQGLRYVRLVEKNLETRGLVDVRKMADILWTSIEFHSKWFDVNLSALASGNRDCRAIVQDLRHHGESGFLLFWRTERSVQPAREYFKWPGHALAHYCMYKVATALLDHHMTEANLFGWIQETISDVVRACLTNIPRVIHLECINSNIEEREERVRNAAFLLGEAAEDILQIFAQQGEDLHRDERSDIDRWIMRLRP